jgi:hypothetical protein
MTDRKGVLRFPSIPKARLASMDEEAAPRVVDCVQEALDAGTIAACRCLRT